VLIGVIAAAVVGVGTIAAVTATVIVDDQGGGELVVQRCPVPVPRQGLPPLGRRHEGQHFRFGPRLGHGLEPGPFRELPGCLRRHGLGRLDQGALPELRKLRRALRACGNMLPEHFPAPPPPSP
jgi:hypothetical protein